MQIAAIPCAKVMSPEQLDGRPAFVSAEISRAVLAWEPCVAALKAAYAIPHSQASLPSRTVARGPNSWLRTLSAVPAGSRFMGAKVFGLGPGGRINYAIILVEQSSGIITAIVDGAAVTAIRTAATSAVALDRLARPGPVSLGILGSGDEARAHVAAAVAVRPVSRVLVYSPTRAKCEAFADHCRTVFGIESRAVESGNEIADCDVLIAAARSQGEKPILHAAMMKPGQLSISIGSTLPEQREADISALAACDLIVCDAVEEVIGESGDMLAARAAGIGVESKVVSLNDLMAGRIDDRARKARQIMYKSVGSALQDVVIAELAFERAQANGLVDYLPINFSTKHI